MENENEICGVCSFPYDSNNHTPRVLINCGHTLCSSCLIAIIKDPKLRKCPFDNNSFKRTQKCLENFPVNFALLAVLEGRNQQNLCRMHQKKLTRFCFRDNVKICSDCELLGDHKGHLIKKIEDLKAKGAKAKKDLEENLIKFEKNNQDVEYSKKKCLVRIGQRIGEINKILKTQRNQVEFLFEKKMGNLNRSLIKQETSKVIEEINEAFEKEENLAVLDRDFSSIISRLQPKVTMEEVSKGADEASRMMSRLESFLVNQIKSLNSFDLSNEERKPEQPVIKEKEQQLTLKDSVIKRTNEPEKRDTMLALEISEGFLLVRIQNPNPNPIPQVIHFGIYDKIKKVKVELQQYDALSQGSTDLKYLAEILQQLKNYTSLVISFAHEGLIDNHALHLLNLLFCRIQHLAEIEISFEQCKISNDPILFFCNNILPKATSLKYLTLKLGFTRFNEKSLFALASSLSHLSGNLQAFTLRAEHTEITDDGIEKVLQAVKRVKSLRLYLDVTGLTDRSLKVLGNKVMPEMKNLKQLSVGVSGTKMTMEGVTAIFTGIPKDISGVSLSFEGINLPYEVIPLFEKIVCPKLKVVEDVHLRLEGKQLRFKASRLLERVRKDADERRKVLESTNKR